MNKFKSSKKIIIIWDFDGAVGQINSTLPYNFNFESLEKEISNVEYILDKLDEYNIKTCFAITGFSAENGIFPYVFPDLIKKISDRGHEIASHSWRHEWIPLFSNNQINKSLSRSKLSLEKVLNFSKEVVGFVPPHNRPMTWLMKGAISMGDLGIYPFFKLGDTGQLIKLLLTNNYIWVRISHKNIFQKFNLLKRNITGKIYKYKNILILENHYRGFDCRVIKHILETNHSTYTISAHPLMLSFENKIESKIHFENFLKKITESNQEIEFILPSNLLL
jgi:peptidoglycan/xylan/chitin deacetylase (PgdA/CDA1 family)